MIVLHRHGMLTIKHGMSTSTCCFCILIFFCIKLFIHFCISNNKFIHPTLSYNIRKDIFTFAITEFSDIFTKTMNRDDASFKSKYTLEKLAHIDKDFTFNITRNLNNKVTIIVWMASCFLPFFQ